MTQPYAHGPGNEPTRIHTCYQPDCQGACMSSESLSYGVRCDNCGHFETACTCSRPNDLPSSLDTVPLPRRLPPGMRTPWGVADAVELLPTGIKRVSTPSHGGYWVPKALLPRIPADYRAYALKWSGSEQWYEEDCAWACVAVTFPEDFDADTVTEAQHTIDHWIRPDGRDAT